MNQQHVLSRSGKGEDQHQGRVEAVGAHVVIAVEGAAAVTEFLVGYEQCAAVAVGVLDDILVAPVVEQVDRDDAVAGVKIPDERALFLGYGPKTVVDVELEEHIALWNRLACEDPERGEKSDGVARRRLERELHVQFGDSEKVGCRLAVHFFSGLSSLALTSTSSGFWAEKRKSCVERYLML